MSNTSKSVFLLSELSCGYCKTHTFCPEIFACPTVTSRCVFVATLPWQEIHSATASLISIDGSVTVRIIHGLHALSFSLSLPGCLFPGVMCTRAWTCAIASGPVERVYLSAPIVAIQGKEANLTVVVWPSHSRTLTFFWWFDNSSEVRIFSPRLRHPQAARAVLFRRSTKPSAWYLMQGYYGKRNEKMKITIELNWNKWKR